MRRPEDLDASERAAVECALGRLFRIMSRPFQAGDDKTYADCRHVVLSTLGDAPAEYRPNWARDRLSGAQGD